jgi:hypothetical protein
MIKTTQELLNHNDDLTVTDNTSSVDVEQPVSSTSVDEILCTYDHVDRKQQ